VEDDFLKNEIAKIFRRYDAELAETVKPDEFGEALRLLPLSLEGDMKATLYLDDWHSGNPASGNKYARAQACLARAVEDAFGKRYVARGKPGPDGLPAPCGLKTFRRKPKLLGRAGKGAHLAELFCCIYFYLKALGELSRYPATPKSAVLESLARAKDAFLCPDVMVALDSVGDLPGPEFEGGARRRVGALVLAVFCLAAVCVAGAALLASGANHPALFFDFFH
jgi:hypothetical protein